MSLAVCHSLTRTERTSLCPRDQSAHTQAIIPLRGVASDARSDTHLYGQILLFMVYDQAFVQKGPPSAKGRKEGATNYKLIEYAHDMVVSIPGESAPCGSSQHQHW